MSPLSTTLSPSESEPDESTRLLPDAERGPVARVDSKATPLPKVQLGTLVAVRVVDPIAYTQIFPYVNQLLVDLGVAAPDQVGFYSGFVESAHALAQVFSVYQLGRLSDVVGRRPVLVSCLVGIALSTLAFGWSTSLLGIATSRFLGGLVSGNIAVLHALLVEMTDDTNQHIAVPIYSLAWSTGTVLGPLIGGTFSNAATRYPVYASWHVFVDHPYLPPCIVTAGCALLGAVSAYCVIEETLPSKRKGAANGGGPQRPPESGAMSMRALLGIPAIRTLTLSGLVLSFMNSAFDVVFALFCYTPVDAGGLGLESATIGYFLALAGTFAVLLRLVAMPYILRRLDYATTYNTCMYLWPVVFASLPPFNALARAHVHAETPTAGVATWTALALVLALSKVAAIPYSINMLLVKRHCTPGVSTHAMAPLGQSNGLVQLAMCLGRAIGPVVVSALFTVLNGSVGSWGWSAVMACFGVVGVRVTRGIR